ncbi:MAG: hypothetical protein AVDCRST_MAG68-2416 [uncultured Gemmatimonadetes bacterium]|uniref:Uncharacterized protein n=1 Tax=uncultured Gemmatimonadota bacterium TaxID=203437 RepID=A0A6J4LDT5_9BACT|nr:MAG: hypothetical protein AVDCRST_MAG68-2416 [uncultured Gemmatimonadota bacterium]
MLEYPEAKANCKSNGCFGKEPLEGEHIESRVHCVLKKTLCLSVR